MVFVIITLLVSPARSQTCPQGCKFTDMFTLLVGEGGQVIGLASKLSRIQPHRRGCILINLPARLQTCPSSLMRKASMPASLQLSVQVCNFPSKLAKLANKNTVKKTRRKISDFDLWKKKHGSILYSPVFVSPLFLFTTYEEVGKVFQFDGLPG